MKRSIYVLITDSSPSAYEPVPEGVTFSAEVAGIWDNRDNYYKTDPRPEYMRYAEKFVVDIPQEALVLAFKTGMRHIADCCDRAPDERVTNGDIALFCDMESAEMDDDEIMGIIERHSTEPIDTIPTQA